MACTSTVVNPLNKNTRIYTVTDRIKHIKGHQNIVDYRAGYTV